MTKKKNLRYQLIATRFLRSNLQNKANVKYLGEWATENPILTNSSKIIPFYWDDNRSYNPNKEVLYVNELYESLLKKLSKVLNQLHGENYSDRYWRILIGPWLAIFIQIYRDRWLTVNNFLSIGEEFNYKGFKIEIDAVTPNSMQDFNQLTSTDLWNQFIFDHIFERREVRFKRSDIEIKKSFLRTSAGKTLSIKRSLISFITDATSLLSVRNSFCIISPYLSNLDEIILNLRLKQFPIKFYRQDILEVNLSSRVNILNENLKPKNTFEFALYSLLKYQIPKCFIEGFHQVKAIAKSSRWPKSPRCIFTSNSLWHDTAFMFYAADKIENGARFVIGQHGANYGTSKFNFSELHEIRVSDYFLTYGWMKSEKTLPIGFFNRRTFLKFSSSNKNKKILVIINNAPRYRYIWNSELNDLKFKEYTLSMFSLISQLSFSFKNQLIIRLPLRDSGFDEVLLYKNKFPDIQIDNKSDIKDLYKKSSLVICTYNSTSFFESITSDIPTLLLLNKKNKIHKIAKNATKLLNTCGIIHYNVDSLCDHVYKFHSNLNNWWSLKSTQKPLSEYKNLFCRNVRNNSFLHLKDIINC